MKFASSLVLLICANQSSAFAPALSHGKSSALHMSGVLGKTTGKSSLDPAVIERYNSLPYPDDTILAEYVWVDADGNTRSKTRTLPAAKVGLKEMEEQLYLFKNFSKCTLFFYINQNH